MIDFPKVFNDYDTVNDYGVSVIEYPLSNSGEIDELATKDWKIIPYGSQYRAMPPRVSLCDLVDLHKVTQYGGDVVLNVAYTSFLNRLLTDNRLVQYVDAVVESKKYQDFVYHIGRGEVLGNEVKIAGSDTRIYELKMDLLREFQTLPDCMDLCEYYIEQGVSNQRGLIRHKIGEVACAYLHNLEQVVGKTAKPVVIERETYAIDMSEMPKNYDTMLFAPFGCFSFLGSFINNENFAKVMFYEMHLDEKSASTTPFSWFVRDLHNQTVLAIDSVYSGGTLAKMKNYIESQRGFPITLGLNPRSTRALNQLDFAMILDRIYDAHKLRDVPGDFFEKTYIKTFSNKGKL